MGTNSKSESSFTAVPKKDPRRNGVFSEFLELHTIILVKRTLIVSEGWDTKFRTRSGQNATCRLLIQQTIKSSKGHHFQNTTVTNQKLMQAEARTAASLLRSRTEEPARAAG